MKNWKVVDEGDTLVVQSDTGNLICDTFCDLGEFSREQCVEHAELIAKLPTISKIRDRALHWQNMSADQMRLQMGEMTAQEIRTVKAVLNNILGDD